MSKKGTVKRAISQASVVNAAQVSAQASRCEEQLDAAIYQCLHALTKRHEPTEDFKALFSRGMFLKPNTKAFIQVMHFLFNIYDAREFRKRFYWPIFDKAAENAFRTSTVEYVNSLIEREKLIGIEKIKAHVVVLPGGVKFMKFLLSLIRLVLQEELRKAKGSVSSKDGEVVTKKSIAQMIDSHKRWTKVACQIHAIVKAEVSVLSKNTEKIDTLIETILKGSDLANTIGYEKLMQLWNVVINSQFKEHQKTQQRTLAIAKEFENIIEKAERKMKCSELTLPFSKEQLRDTLVNFNQQDSDCGRLSQEVFDENGKLDPMKLIRVFELVLPTVEHFFENFCFKNPELIKYEQKELTKGVVRLDDLRQQMDVLQRQLPILEDCLLSGFHGNEESPEVAKYENFAIKNKLFCTPPIFMDFDGHSDDAFTANSAVGKSVQRLALLNKEDVQLMNARMKLLSTSVYQARSPRPQLKYNKTPVDPPRSSPNLFAVPRAARKEKLNPLTMLNRIKAQSQKHIGSDGKPAHSNPSVVVNSTMNISTLSEMSLRPEFSSTLLGTPEKPGVAPTKGDANEHDKENAAYLHVPSQMQHRQQMQRVIHSPNMHSSPRLIAIYVGSTTTPKSARSPNSLLMVGAGGRKSSSSKRNSLITNESVHTSPSGRLESMVKQSELIQACEIPSALQEEMLMDTSRDREAGNIVDDKTLSPNNGGQQDDLSSTLLATSVQSHATLVPSCHHPPEELSTTRVEEKNEEIFEGQLYQPQSAEPEDDDLFNVSDGILTDID